MSLFTHFKNLSLKNIIQSVGQMIQRFPLVVATTLFGTWLGLYIIEQRPGLMMAGNLDWQMKALFMCILGLFLFLGLTLGAERLQLKKATNLLLQLGGVLLLVLYYFLLPARIDDFTTPQNVTLILLNAIGFLIILFLPFLKKTNSLGEWKYIETLFIRLFVTAVFSITLFTGLALSLWSIEYLFKVNWDGEIYFQVWALVVGIFSTWFYLSGFPTEPEKSDDHFSYPTVLRVFVQYILVPLLCIFYVILYAYVGKILVTWDWPLGGVAIWILVFSIAGVLSYLIGYPMLKDHDFPWLKKFFTIFFILIIPLAIVLFMAVGIRIKEYGITEQRYLVVVFGLWLIAVALYYLLSKKKYVQFVPMLTAAVFLFSLIPPWSMFFLSVWSQFNRLEDLLVQNNILVNGKAQKVAQPGEDNYKQFDYKQIESIRSRIQFLAEHGEVDKIQPWFPQDLATVTSTEWGRPYYSSDSYHITAEAMKALGLSSYGDSFSSIYFSFSSNASYFGSSAQAVSTENYQYIVPKLYLNRYPEEGRTISFGDRKLEVKFTVDTIEFWEGKNKLGELNLQEYISKLIKKYPYTPHTGERVVSLSEAQFTLENTKIKIKIYFTQLSGERRDDQIIINSLDGTLFVSFP